MRRAYSVTLKDVKRFEKLVDVALKNGANRLLGFEFRTTDLRKHRDEARKNAILAAKEKAQALAAALGQELGDPTSIGEGWHGLVGNRRSWWGWQRGGMSQNYTSHAGNGGTGGATLPLGEIGVSARINVSFQMRPKNAPEKAK